MLVNSAIVKSSPSLFIYIPTFNRVKLLERQLEALSSQLVDFPGRVRILVSINDASNLEYDSLMGKYSCENIFFRENPGNLGGNPNITLGFIFARIDEFLWILSDDDMVLPDSLQEIFSAIGNHLDIIHIGEYDNREVLDLNLQNFLILPKGAGFGMISAAIFNIKYFSTYLRYGFEYLDSSFPHLAILMAALKKEGVLKMGCALHSNVFSGEKLDTHGSAEYAVSSLGFGYLADFLSGGAKVRFLDGWFKASWRGFLAAKETHRTKYNRALGYFLVTHPKIIIYIFSAKWIRHISNLKRKMVKLLGYIKC